MFLDGAQCSDSLERWLVESIWPTSRHFQDLKFSQWDKNVIVRPCANFYPDVLWCSPLFKQFSLSHLHFCSPLHQIGLSSWKYYCNFIIIITIETRGFLFNVINELPEIVLIIVLTKSSRISLRKLFKDWIIIKLPNLISFVYLTTVTLCLFF